MPFSLLDLDVLESLYATSLDGILIEHFDPPYNAADLQDAGVPTNLDSNATIVYMNPALIRLGNSYDADVAPMLDSNIDAVVEAFFDEMVQAQWQQRLRTPIDNLQLAGRTKTHGKQELPQLMLSTHVIEHQGLIYGCCSRVADATNAIKKDVEERHALQRIEAFIRTENLPLLCLEFAKPLPSRLLAGELGEAYNTSTISHVTDSAATLFGTKSSELIVKKLSTIRNKQVQALLAGAFPADGYNEPINLGDTAEVLVEVSHDQTSDASDPHPQVYRIKPTFVFNQGLAVEVWLRIEDESSNERSARRLDALEQTRNLALEAASLYQFVIELNTEVVTLDDTGLRAMGLTDMPTHLAGWKELLQTDKLNISAGELKRQLNGKDEALSFIARLKNNVGEDRYLEIWSKANPDANKTGYSSRSIGLYRDVTQSEKLNARLSEKKTLESLGVLAGGVAHDFNNLLMSVLGYAELMQANIQALPQDNNTPALQSALSNVSEIRTAALRASELCASLLAYAGQYLIEKKALNLTTLVRTTAELLSITAGKRSPLRLDLASEVTVDADQGQLTQVIVNLVGNAAEAMEDKPGVVHIEVNTAHLTSEEQRLLSMQMTKPTQPVACLTVRDTGIGMSTETMKRIYEPFYTTKNDGRGLGMAAVHGIIKNHGGGILMDSIQGAGTEFRIFLPLSKQTPNQKPNHMTNAPGEASTKPKVLVVDDEADVRQIAAEMLRHLACDVMQADSAKSALGLIANHRFDYALLDITMPMMSGAELAKILLEKSPGLNVVLCSGYSDKEVSEDLLAHCAFLQKPYTLREVSKVLNLN